MDTHAAITAQQRISRFVIIVKAAAQEQPPPANQSSITILNSKFKHRPRIHRPPSGKSTLNLYSYDSHKWSVMLMSMKRDPVPTISSKIGSSKATSVSSISTTSSKIGSSKATSVNSISTTSSKIMPAEATSATPTKSAILPLRP